MTEPILQVERLSLRLLGREGPRSILEELSFTVHQGEKWAIAGESGAGKSMTVHALSALLPRENVVVEGRVLYRDRDGTVTDLLSLPYPRRQPFCAQRVSLIPQDAMNALNPHVRIGRQWCNVLRLHRKETDGRRARQYMEAQLSRFGLPEGENLLEKYPHQLSGGMRQRIVIAMALESPAKIVIADEPTTALDTINQRKIVDLIRQLCEERRLTLLYVSHNLGLLNALCTHALILRRGRAVELGRTDAVFRRPQHPYTGVLVEQTGRLLGGGAP